METGLRSIRSFAFVAVVFGFGSGVLLGAGGKRAVCDVQYVEKPPVLDGKMDDECWRSAPVISDFRQVLPVEGAKPSERTEVRFVYTRKKLYVGLRCFDSDPGGIIVKVGSTFGF